MHERRYGCQCRRTATAARMAVRSRSEWLSSASSTCSRQDCILTRHPGKSASCAECRARPSKAARPLTAASWRMASIRACRSSGERRGPRSRISAMRRPISSLSFASGSLVINRLQLNGGSRRLVKQPLRLRVKLTESPVFVIGRRDLKAAAAAFLFSSWDRSMAKPATVKIKLVSSADTGFFYVTKKNPRTQTEKLSIRKYDPVARKHVEFKEAKIK